MSENEVKTRRKKWQISHFYWAATEKSSMHHNVSLYSSIVYTARCLESINLSASLVAPTVLNSADFHTSKSLRVYTLTQEKPNF